MNTEYPGIILQNFLPAARGKVLLVRPEPGFWSVWNPASGSSEIRLWVVPWNRLPGDCSVLNIPVEKIREGINLHK